MDQHGEGTTWARRKDSENGLKRSEPDGDEQVFVESWAGSNPVKNGYGGWHWMGLGGGKGGY